MTIFEILAWAILAVLALVVIGVILYIGFIILCVILSFIGGLLEAFADGW